jgi:hypothetical protein
MTQFDPRPWGDLTFFRIYSEGLADAKKARVSAENRVLRGGAAEPDQANEIIDLARATEAQYERMLLDAYKVQVPEHVQAWARSIPGIASGELFPRLLGMLGHPRIAVPQRWEGSKLLYDGDPRPRTIRQLWQYCGCGDPLIVPRRDILGHTPTREEKMAGGKRTVIRPLLFTFSSYLVRAHTRSETVADSLFYKILVEAKAAAEGNVHARQCQNKKIPPMRSNGCGTVAHPEWGAPGSPWRPGHVDMHAHRLVAKEFLRQLWLVSA